MTAETEAVRRITPRPARGPAGVGRSRRWSRAPVARRAAAALAVVVAPVLLAFAVPVGGAAAAEIQVGRLHYPGGGDWYANPSSLPNWLEQFAARTGLPTAREEGVVTLDSEDLYRYPLLYITGHGRIALAESELTVLRRYLDAGGFLWADDNYGLDASFREMIKRLYPDSPLRRIGSDDPVYHAFYALPGLPKIHEHDGEPAQGFGVYRGGRLVVYYSFSGDIGDGLEDPEVHGDPPALREAAARMAVNVLMYALTSP
ncbi:MAG: DUF4159 domain-containing protein [Candidatus Krumholzibacteriia bacterium]